MFKFLEIEPESFGLDISDLSLKIARLRKKQKKGFTLVSVGEQEIKPGIVKDGIIKDEDALVKIIKKGISEVRGDKIRTEYVVCSLPEEKGFLEVIQMPKMEEADLKKAIRYEAENHIPLSADKVYLDSQIIRPAHNHTKYVEILTVAFPKEVVNPYVSCLKEAGLQPRALELESLAIARALVENEVASYDLLLIDMGVTKTSFIIFSGYSLRFTSSISISSEEFTKAIAGGLGVGLKEADKLKIKYGVEGKRVKGKKVLEVLVPSLKILTDKVKKHLSFYLTHSSNSHLQPGRKGIEKIILSGGGANLKGLTGFLNSELKIPVEIGNPWINILLDTRKRSSLLSDKESLRYVTALGLALRGIKKEV